MRKFAPLALLTVGLLVMLGAFLCLAGNALPYQDPTAELLAHQASEARKWNILFLVGLVATATGAIWLLVRRRAKRRAKKLKW